MCPQNHQLWSEGNCFSCNEKNAVHTTKKECLKCQNRDFIDDVCVLKCNQDFFHSSDKYIDTSIGITIEFNQLDHPNALEAECIHCSSKNTYYTSKENCNLCQNRKFQDGKCYLKK